MSQSMIAEGSGVSAWPSAARGLGLGASGAAIRSGSAVTGAGGRSVAGAGGLISRVTGRSRVTGLSPIAECSRGTATRGLDAVGRAGIAACASIGAALTGARRSGSAGRLASPDAGLDGASAGGPVTTAGAGDSSSRAGAGGGCEAVSEAVRAELSPRPVSHHAR